MPRSSASRHSQNPSTFRSASGRSRVFESMIRRTSAVSSGVLSRSPARAVCATAASQPARLNTNTIAGSRLAASIRWIMSVRDGGLNPLPRDGLPVPAPRLRPRLNGTW